MSRTTSGQGGTWLGLASLAVLFYGAEHWRRRAARRAESREHQRFEALAVCALGPDAGALIYAPGAMRRRLRALAMQTTLEAEETWMDRCIPLARLLAVHGTEVDSTGQVTSAPTHVEARATELARAVARLGLVWQVRAGDTAVDMDRLADLFASTAAEIGIAHNTVFHVGSGPVAPTAAGVIPSLRLSVAGLTPLVAGGPSRFLVGAPLPLVTAVTVQQGTLRAEVVSNSVASWWRVSDDGILRVGSEIATPDGLSPVVLEGLRGALGTGRIAAPPENTDRTGVSYDAAILGDSLWLAQALRGHGAVLARLSGQSTTAVRLDLGSTPSTRALSETRRFDPRVAVTATSAGVWAAFTRPLPPEEQVGVTVVRTQGGARSSIVAVPFVGDAWALTGRRPELTFCQTAHTMWLFAAAHDGWRAAIVDGAGVRAVHSFAMPARQWADESLTVRCDADRALVYARERPRANPMMLCRDDGTCLNLPRVSAREPAGATGFVSQGVHGEQVAHAERPFSAAALGDGSVVMARSFGPVVSVARWTPSTGRWSTDRAVYDAAADEPANAITGVALYSAGTHLVLAFTTSAELRVSASDDGGAHWRVP